MKTRHIALILLMLALSVGIFRMRNFIRFVSVQQHRPIEVKLDQLEYHEEGSFEVYIYAVTRTWKSRSMHALNKVFSDELILFKIPISRMRFENVTEAPMGNESRHDFDCWFNTQYFMENKEPCDGWKDNQIALGSPRFEHLTVQIDSDGVPRIQGRASRNSSNQLFECRHAHRSGQNQPIFMDNLNYRSYLAITSDFVYYAVGHGNSLISCRDADALMKLHDIDRWIITDGGTSIDYRFKGNQTKYQFSSVPFRSVFSKWNSPFYLGGKCPLIGL